MQPVMKLPLEHIVVVELGHSVAAPIAGLILAELGATVIKIENPQGGDDARNWGPPFLHGAAGMFQAINRNKYSAALDLKDDAERETLRRYIVGHADIVVQNMRPGLVERYGLDAASLRKDKPSLIYCNLTAFGAEGPLKDTPGYDPLLQAFGGLMSVTGHEGTEPVRTGPSIIDQGAGMWAAIGILAVLLRRNETGEGCEVNTSLFETALSWMCMHTAMYLASGNVPKRGGSENGGMAPYKAYQARDGWVVIAAANDNLFRRFAQAVGHPEWADDPDMNSNSNRVRNRDKVNALVAGVIATQTRQYWIDALAAASVPCAPLQSLDEVLDHPQTAAVKMLQQSADGKFRLMGVPLQFDGARPAFRKNPPALAEDNGMLLPENSARRSTA
jgi:crotonobetainyl-CoA:carnitine CoA-transferase CaiB-like acyl-CoA transferase